MIAAAAVAIAVTGLTTPLMARVALAIGLLDRPGGYKQHERATPCLGGAAILLGVTATVLLLQGVQAPVGVLLLAATATCALGAADDWRPVPPLVRLAAQAAIGAGIWAGDAGWATGSPPWLELLLTVAWIVAAANTFNLLDNLDGAASSVAAACSLGVAAIAIANGGPTWAAITATALLGACLGFLPFNLSRPARVFLGDGGSTMIGILIAVAAMGTLNLESSPSVYLTTGLLIGVPVLDTALVVISRQRRGISMLTGGRDHLTHRLNSRVGDPRKVAVGLAAVQLMLSAAAACAVLLGPRGIFVAAACYAVAVTIAITALETLGVRTGHTASPPPTVEGRGIQLTTSASGANNR